jgi:hypothetical protein
VGRIEGNGVLGIPDKSDCSSSSLANRAVTDGCSLHWFIISGHASINTLALATGMARPHPTGVVGKLLGARHGAEIVTSLLASTSFVCVSHFARLAFVLGEAHARTVHAQTVTVTVLGASEGITGNSVKSLEASTQCSSKREWVFVLEADSSFRSTAWKSVESDRAERCVTSISGPSLITSASSQLTRAVTVAALRGADDDVFGMVFSTLVGYKAFLAAS